jgi:hypothetical protein
LTEFKYTQITFALVILRCFAWSSEYNIILLSYIDDLYFIPLADLINSSNDNTLLGIYLNSLICDSECKNYVYVTTRNITQNEFLNSEFFSIRYYLVTKENFEPYLKLLKSDKIAFNKRVFEESYCELFKLEFKF